jgi:hypothetical protein
MDNAAGWQPDPEREDQERYWNGSEWTDRVRPAGKARSLHLPEHVPELQRALAASTADIDAVEDRLSNLFDRTEGKTQPDSARAVPAAPRAPASPEPAPTTAEPDLDDDEIIDLLDEPDDVSDDEDPIHEEFAGPTGGGRVDAEVDDGEDDDAAFAELDAALAAEEPEESEEPASKRRFFRRRS